MTSIRITSGGNTLNTRVTLADTDEELDNVVGVTWECTMGDDGSPMVATAVVTFELVEVDVTGDGLVAEVESAVDPGWLADLATRVRHRLAANKETP